VLVNEYRAFPLVCRAAGVFVIAHSRVTRRNSPLQG
jgi:hypothetical protein